MTLRTAATWLHVAGGDERLAVELAEAEWSGTPTLCHPWYVGSARVETRLDLRGLTPADLDGLPFSHLLRPRDDGRSVAIAGAVLRWPSSRGTVTRRRAIVGFGWSEVLSEHGRPVRCRRWFEAELTDDPA